MFNKILIANRGEIACRIIKTAKKLGIKTVAVYSNADKNALFVKDADEAYLIGPAAAAESYLKYDKIIDVAKTSGAEAIHPGYGFLSENTDFAKACERAGVVFIGPSAQAIKAMGDKSEAKKIMQEAGVPIAPSFDGDVSDKAKLKNAAEKIGLPILVKAAFGGGGRGMRLVNSLNELQSAVESAQREAQKSFANGTVFLEKYIEPARHIEVQVFADNYGNVVHLFDRDCSIQRRHQKVIEEAPAPNLKDATRAAMYAAAINAAKAINYSGAGTIEFLVDANEHFYFMEMNTRLQVEHPVTEMITGLDLVEWQLRVAADEALPLKQNEIKQRGHAIETRICAETPEKDFMPSSGKLIYFQPPVSLKNARLDTGFMQDSVISPYYDSMIAKLIVYSDNRDQAILDLNQALKEFYIVGVDTNIHFLTKILAEPDFQKLKLATTFIDKHQDTLFSTVTTLPEAVLSIATAAHQMHFSQFAFDAKQSNDVHSPWLIRDKWRMVNEPAAVRFWVDEAWIAASGAEHPPRNDETVKTDHSTFFYNHEWHVFYEGEHFILPLEKNSSLVSGENSAKNSFTAQMPGTVSAVLVTPGQAVKAGDKLMILEAMKMEHTIEAPCDGTVKAVYFKPGDTLNEGVQLLAFD